MTQLRDEIYSLAGEEITKKTVESLKTKYAFLYSKSPTLFDMVCSDKMAGAFDRASFDKNVTLFLGALNAIESKAVNEEQASIVVGEFIAKDYLPSE